MIIFFNDIIIPINCKLIKAFSQITSKEDSFPQLALYLPDKGSQSGKPFSSDNRIQTFPFSNVAYKAGELFSARIDDRSLNVGSAQITFLFEMA